jgi:hypothetical protein
MSFSINQIRKIKTSELTINKTPVKRYKVSGDTRIICTALSTAIISILH